MDRRTALDKLELVRPDANDAQDPDFAEALAYLDSDEDARAQFERQQEQDREISQAMQELPVPDGLKARLLEALTQQSAVVETKPAPWKSRRRWLLSAAVVAASCMLAWLGFWVLGPNTQPLLHLTELEAEAPFEAEEIARLPEFSGEFEPTLPAGVWMSERQFSFSTPPKGFSRSRSGSDRAAVYEFAFSDRQNPHLGELRGVMLVLPKSALTDIPESQSFLDGAYVTHQTKPNVAIRAWAEGDLVYLCFVPIQDFDALNRLFDITVG